MSTETKTDREMLAEWWATFDGPAYPTGEQFADAILASDWLRERDGLMRVKGGMMAVDGDPAGRFPEVQGHCPVCFGNLFLGTGGYVTCSRDTCSEPDAASTLLGAALLTPETSAE